MQMDVNINSIDELTQAADTLLKQYPENRLFAFYGVMGAGKTTFIKAICKCLGSADRVTSPTFTLVNEYVAGNAEPIYHFDFYRINRISEVFDFGIEEYLERGYYCFMEWPDLIEEVLPDNVVKIKLTVNADNSRNICSME